MAEPIATSLSEVYEEVVRCNKCGFCQSTCPVYRVTGHERSVARGHHTHVRGVIEGRLALNEDLRAGLRECLLCRACVTACFPAIRTDEIVVAARAAYNREHGQPLLERILFRHILTDSRRMALCLQPLFRAKRRGISRIGQRTGLFARLDGRLAAADDIFFEPPRAFLRASPVPQPPPRSNSTQVAYFVGCADNFLTPQIGMATLRVLSAAGCHVELVDNNCCGLPAYAHGDIDAARSVAKRNLRILKEVKAEAIVTDCAGCYSFLKEYPRLLSAAEPSGLDAATVAGRVREFSQYLLTLGLPGAVKPLAVRATYHDPCHLSRHQKVINEPRQILSQVPGLHLEELPEADWCCGGAGTYNIEHRDQSHRIVERKMQNVGRTAATVLATSCPACLLQLSYGARMMGLRLEVLHVSQVVDRALRLG